MPSACLRHSMPALNCTGFPFLAASLQSPSHQARFSCSFSVLFLLSAAGCTCLHQSHCPKILLQCSPSFSASPSLFPCHQAYLQYLCFRDCRIQKAKEAAPSRDLLTPFGQALV